MIKFSGILLIAILLLNGCSKKTEVKSQDPAIAIELKEIADQLEKAYWSAEEKRIADATKSKDEYTKWETFQKEHEVKIEGIHTSDSSPPVLTGVIRLLIPAIKDSYYEFHFQHTDSGWLSTEAFIVAPDRGHDFYRDPFPNSKSLKEFLPAELIKLGAPVINK